MVELPIVIMYGHPSTVGSCQHRAACEELWARRTNVVTPLRVGRTVLFWYNGTVQLVS